MRGRGGRGVKKRKSIFVVKFVLQRLMQISRVVLGIGINGVVDNTEENIGWYKKM
jgi:hypothetical protein